MRIIDTIGAETFRHSICTFSGGGGKSSLIYRTAEELASEGFRVLVTTTTMMYHPEVKNRPFSSLLIGDPGNIIKESALPGKGSITVAASEIIDSGEGKKIKGFSGKDTDLLAAEGIFDTLLVEGDGSRHLPIKAPSEGEPVIPAKTGILFGVIGMDAIGAEISGETVFRLENFLSVTGTSAGDIIDRNVILNLINAEDGLFKGAPAKSEKVLFLNKADTPTLVKTAAEAGEYIMEKTRIISRIIITSAISNNPVKKEIKRKNRYESF